MADVRRMERNGARGFVQLEPIAAGILVDPHHLIAAVFRLRAKASGMVIDKLFQCDQAARKVISALLDDEPAVLFGTRAQVGVSAGSVPPGARDGERQAGGFIDFRLLRGDWHGFLSTMLGRACSPDRKPAADHANDQQHGDQHIDVTTQPDCPCRTACSRR